MTGVQRSDRYRETRNGVANVRPNEIEPGRTVPNNWDKHLVEPWAERKRRLAAERASNAAGSA